MIVKELINKLKLYNPNMEVLGSDGNYLKPFSVFTYSGAEIEERGLELWDENMINPEHYYIMIILED